VRVCLTIAGSDSGAGAGIQADLKTFAARGQYGVCAITAVTAQNTLGVQGIWSLPAEAVRAQLESLFADFDVAAAKTGMILNAETVGIVAQCLREHPLPNLVVDPVMRAKSGDALLAPEAQAVLVNELLPLALVLTPNLAEAEALLEAKITSLADMAEAAAALSRLGPKAVLLKGGHLEDAEGESVDVLYHEGRVHQLAAPRLRTRDTHGTGCTLSAAIAAELAQGHGVVDACRRAKEYLTAALAAALHLGHGVGPFDHFVWGAPRLTEQGPP